MVIFWKNKGFFVLTYISVFGIIIGLTSKFLKDYVGGVFASNYNEMILIGIVLILSGISSIITDVITINNRKIEIDIYQSNELFFVPMKQCGYFLIVMGVLNLIFGILEN